MGSERGSAALVVVGVLALSTAVGVGVYFLIRNQRAASAQTAAQVEPPPPVAAPAPIPEPPRAEPEVPQTPPTTPVDVADADAVDPEVGGGPPETNAPTFGTPGVEGHLDKDGIATAVRATSPKLQRCFEKRLAAGARIGGTLRATLLVNRRGGVDSATSVGVEDELGTCVTSVLKDVRLPRTKDGGIAKVVYPIAFHHANGDDDGDVRRRDDACDEVSCVLDNYEPACCARFKRPSTTPVTGLPDAVSREQLGVALKALRGQVARCASAQEFSGTLKVRFRVLPTGKVGDVTIADVEPELSACIARVFKAYTFPESVNGVSVSFPFSIQLEER